MRATNRLKRIQLWIALVFLAACQPPDFSKIAETPASLLKISKKALLKNMRHLGPLIKTALCS